MAGQIDSEFRTMAITETSRNLQYNFLSSPIPFECPDTILSTPLSSSTPHTMRMESNSRVFTPIPCQPRVSTPYPVIDSVATGKDWPAGISPENRLFPSSWGFESTVHIGQQFQGSVLPMTTSTSHTLHHYSFPQTWHHAVTTPQSLSGYNLSSNDFWYPGDSSLIEGFGNVDVGGDMEQDSKVTSSTESMSPWKPELVLPPVSELLNSSHGNIKSEGISPMEAMSAAYMAASAMSAKPKQATPSTAFTSKEAKTQTPWKIKKSKSSPVIQSQNKRKERKPRKNVDPVNYMQQKAVQRKREKAIRDKIKHLSTMLPWADLKNSRPSRKEVLESAISRIIQLQENIREAYLQKGLKTEDLKAALQDNLMFNFSDGPFDVSDQADDLALISDECNSFPSTPELVVDENLSVTSASPISELGSQGCDEAEGNSVPSLKTDEKSQHVKRPMNSFMLFSREYRSFFKRLYPGRDNRKISSLLADEWRRMKPEEKQPYKDRQKELMRITKESHPDFKYCEGIKKIGGGVIVNVDGNKQAGLDQGYRIGPHILRQRGSSFTHTNAKSLAPAPKKICLKQNNKANIKVEQLPERTSEMLVTSETKLTKKIVTPSIPPNRDKCPSTVKQVLQSSDNQGGHSVEANMDWHPNTCDVWLQCENCKKWHMLPDESDPTSLPDKWYCCVNANRQV